MIQIGSHRPVLQGLLQRMLQCVLQHVLSVALHNGSSRAVTGSLSFSLSLSHISQKYNHTSLLQKNPTKRRLFEIMAATRESAAQNTKDAVHCYWVATISRLLKIIGIFCKRALEKRLYSAKETYNFKELFEITSVRITCNSLFLHVDLTQKSTHLRLSR